MSKVKEPVVFVGIDVWNRPIFRSKINLKKFFGSVDMLFNYETEEQAVQASGISEKDLCYFGSCFGCEPDGGLAGPINIEWTVAKKG